VRGEGEVWREGRKGKVREEKREKKIEGGKKRVGEKSGWEVGSG